jgi:hypothetical protein
MTLERYLLLEVSCIKLYHLYPYGRTWEGTAEEAETTRS